MNCRILRSKRIAETQFLPIRFTRSTVENFSWVLFKLKSHRRFIHSAAILLATLSVAGQACAFGIDKTGANIHSDITRDALLGTFSEANLKVIIDANVAQDKPGSEALAELRRHFGEAQFNSSIGYIDREKKRALNYAAESDTDTESRGYALRHFGEMLHVAQDFYSRTNYIELMLRNPDFRNDPFTIPLVDWQKIPLGYPGLESFNIRAGQTEDAEKSAMLVKDSPQTPGGAKVATGKTTFFQIARELAIRETQRQWNQFEAMLRNRCGTRAPAVIAAIKEASPETKISQDKEE